MFGDAYAGRRVFVTGHTGFKGTWLSEWLLDLGAQVTGYALDPESRPNMFESVGLIGGYAKPPDVRGTFRDMRGDVRDRESLSAALAEAEPEIIFHLAAQPLVRRSYSEPHLTLDTNVMGTVHLLEAVRSLCGAGRGPEAVVVVTSDKCYENPETGYGCTEADSLGGWDVYSASKACAEIVTSAYRRSFFLAPGSPRLATARAGNVIGGGDWGVDRIVPDCARALIAGHAVEVRNPDAVRPWQHVLESLSGYLWLGARLWRAEVAGGDPRRADACAWNLGPGTESSRTVREVVELFLRAWGDGEWRLAPGAGDQPHEAGLLNLDASKAHDLLGWRPVWAVEEAVDATAGWYRAWCMRTDVTDVARRTHADLAAYQEAARALSMPWVE